MSLVKLVLGIGLAGLATAHPQLAMAQECAGDADCLDGYTCRTETITRESAPRCAADMVCDPAPLPTTTTYSFCQPKACVVDGDCGAGQVCHTTVNQVCPPNTIAAPCAAGAVDCPTADPVPVTCTNTSVSLCTFPWQLPCSSDTACGEGFVCEPRSYGVCTGSTGTTSAGTGIAVGSGTATEAGASPEETTNHPTTTCTTTTSYPGSCVPAARICETDADCPASFLCKESPSAGGATPATAVDVGGTEAAPLVPAPMPAVDPVKTCVSPLSRLGTDATLAIPTKAAEGAPGNGGTQVTSTEAPAPTVEDTAAAGGCQMGQPARGSVAGLTLLGLVGLLLRRGRRD